MHFRKSLRFKILFAFVIMIIPMSGFLFYLNLYAMNVVRDQVSKNYSNLLAQYVKQTDNILQETTSYMLQQERNPDFIILNSYAYKTDDYVLTRQRIYNRLSTDLNFYNQVSGFFLYSKQNDDADDLIVATQSDYQERTNMIRQELPALIGTYSNSSTQWTTWHADQGYVIGRIVPISPQLYVGAFIDLESLAEPLYGWDVGEGGSAEIVSDTGYPMTKNTFYAQIDDGTGAQATNAGKSYRTLYDEDTKSSYLLVDSHSQFAAIRYLLIVPEKKILQNLPFFQKALSWIPIAIAIILMLYIIFLQRTFFQPMTRLMRGMRRIGQGRFDVRLNERTSSEFSFLNNAFNDMAGQIEHLKISVYEERLRVQQAEFKQLQVQINPHFYMNCLNIIYNLAALKEHKIVQKMALHLSDYFRFIMMTNRVNVTVDAEFKHIVNYLEIQKLRYPDQLTYHIEVAKPFHSCLIPPLAIQPFVENAVVHGFQRGSDPFHIRLEVAADEQQDGFLNIIVSDNGSGFSPEVLNKLQSEHGLQASGDAPHIGIWNVCHRLRLSYGEQAKVSFENRAEAGARITVRLPAQYEWAKEDATDV